MERIIRFLKQILKKIGIMPEPKPIDDSKKEYIKSAIAELRASHDKLAKSYNEILELLKQVQEGLEKE